MSWTDWTNLYEPLQHWEPAAYRVRLLKDGKPFPMNRVLGLDEKGLLSIGKTKNMEGRRAQFVSGVMNGYGHSEGNLLRLLVLYSGLKDHVPSQPQIECQFLSCKSEDEATETEARLLKDYLCRFGELPPLNSAIPNRYDETTWRLIEEVATAPTR
jgi:hypothetical protein